MAALSKIDSLGLGEFVLELAGHGKGSRDIAQELEHVHNVKIAYTSVNNWLKSVRKERAETTKAVVQDAIKATVPRDLEILDEQIAQMDAWRKDDSLKISDRLYVISEQRKTISEKLKYSGAGEASPGDALNSIADELKAARERAERG